METNSKRIAKNTMFLYMRMLFLMFINFYTSRVVLDKLGVNDFGINNVIAGITSLFTFFSSSLANASQRFINYALGERNIDGAKKVFNQHLIIYVIFIAIVVILAETIGLWFVKEKLVIPPARLNAALWVYQFTIFSAGITLLGVIFYSTIIAHENMKFFSYVGITEGVLKLFIAYIIGIVSFDHLIAYSFLMAMSTLAIQSCYAQYCFTHFSECKIKITFEYREIFKTLSFIGWNLYGTIIYMLKDQGLNILLNLFFGPTINAARAISYQVSSAICNFSNSFYTSVEPQIIKSYASKNTSYLTELYLYSTKYSLFLMWLLCLPLMLSVNTVLHIWLKEVPAYTNIFIIWILIDSLLAIMTFTPWTLTLAVGKLKKYVFWGNGVLILILPISYFVLKQGCNPISVFKIIVFVRILHVILTVNISRKFINLSFATYLKKVIIPVTKVFLLSGTLTFSLRNLISSGIMSILVIAVISTVSILFCIYILGLSPKEIAGVKNIILRKIAKNKMKKL